jgi:hypothetical protein
MSKNVVTISKVERAIVGLKLAIQNERRLARALRRLDLLTEELGRLKAVTKNDAESLWQREEAEARAEVYRLTAE